MLQLIDRKIQEVFHFYSLIFMRLCETVGSMGGGFEKGDLYVSGEWILA